MTGSIRLPGAMHFLLPFLVLAAMLTWVPAHAQVGELPQDLYLDAMQSIAEGRQSDASEALRRMIQKEPQHAGAWLDLALMQCELGNAAEAERLFQVIEQRFAPPPVILEVMARRRELGCLGWQPQSRFSISLGRGADNNVNQGASNATFTVRSDGDEIALQLLPEYLPQSDQFTLLTMEYWRTLSPNGTIAFAQFQAQQNDSLTQYNTMSLLGGLDVPWRWGDWSAHGTGSLAALTLGGELYQTQSRLQGQFSHALTDQIQGSLISSITKAAYQTQSQFNSNTWELGSQLNWRNDWSSVFATVSYLNDHALGERPGGDRHGWLARLTGRAQLANKLTGELGWSQQRWQSDTPYSPGIIDTTRAQKTAILRSSLTYQLAPQQALILEWRAVRNDENISIFQYSGQQIKLSWQWQTGM